MLAQTLDRISGTIAADRVVFALTRAHAAFYTAALHPVPPVRKVVQPSNRGTLPAILWSLLRVSRLDPRAIVALLPSDHYFADPQAFAAALEAAFAFAESGSGSVVLLGAAPAYPETEYGWIESDRDNRNSLGVAAVKRFWEKPAPALAARLFARGCVWNTFVMVGAADAFLAMMRRASPGFCKSMERLLLRPGGAAETEIRSLYSSLPVSDFSRQVLPANTGALFVLDFGDIGWSDLGDPHRFLRALAAAGVQIPSSLKTFCGECAAGRSCRLRQPASESDRFDDASLALAVPCA